MSTILDVGWGSYLGYEGPFFRGTASFSLGSTYTDNDRTLAVITSTEGGHYDAINMYDRCILSSGLIQWCESGQYSVSDMIGAVMDRDQSDASPLLKYAASVGVDFKKNNKGRWRFFFRDSRGEVDRTDEQKQLFLLRSSGLKGSWDASSKEYAKGWAAAVATTFQNPTAQRAQIDFTVPKLMGFVTDQAKTALWGNEIVSSVSSNDWKAAGKAAYISFAANLPSKASDSALAYINEEGGPVWSPDWTTGLLYALTFSPGIAIYPARYNAISPVLQRLYGVSIPNTADDLKAWNDGSSPDSDTSGMSTVVEVQNTLIKLGFDLGPAGADGKFGPKTRDAVLTFQKMKGINATGVIDNATRIALLKAIS